MTTPISEAPAPALTSVKPRSKRWSVEEYERLLSTGVFDGQRLELMDGDIIEMTPMNEPHAASVTNTAEELTVPLHGRMKVRNQTPLNAGAYGRPEPDIAVVSLDALLPDQPPSRAELIIEVSDSTLAYDQGDKSSLYASLGVPDYWIINLQENVLEVRRAPIERPSARFDFDYSQIQIIPRGGSVSPLVAPDVSLQVDDLLP
jgi:Uma2 family endonuclease